MDTTNNAGLLSIDSKDPYLETISKNLSRKPSEQFDINHRDSRSRSNSIVLLDTGTNESKITSIASKNISPDISLQELETSGDKILVPGNTFFLQRSASKKHWQLSSPMSLSTSEHHSFEMPSNLALIIGNLIINNKIETDKQISLEQEGFTLEDIEDWNAIRGNLNQKNVIKKYYNDCLLLGGLIPSNHPINIPEARLGLCALAFATVNPKLRLDILESLLTLLKNDDFTEDSYHLLMDLAIHFVKLVNKHEIQKASITIEIKLMEIFRVLTECLHVHAAKGHFMGIDKDTKFDFIEAANAIKKLNRIKHRKIDLPIAGYQIDFNTACCLEWLRQIKDDRQELYNLAMRIYNLAVAGLDVYKSEPDEGFKRVEAALKTKDAHLPNLPGNWYNYLVALRALLRNVKSPSVQNKQNIQTMLPILKLINENYAKLDWKFTFGAIETLFELALNGSTPEIRLQALKGMSAVKVRTEKSSKKGKQQQNITLFFPGLTYFTTCKELSKTVDLNPIVHFEKPEWSKSNRVIREFAIRKLMELAGQSKDPVIVKEAQTILNLRAKDEKHQYIRDMIA